MPSYAISRQYNNRFTHVNDTHHHVVFVRQRIINDFYDKWKKREIRRNLGVRNIEFYLSSSVTKGEESNCRVKIVI